MNASDEGVEQRWSLAILFLADIKLWSTRPQTHCLISHSFSDVNVTRFPIVVSYFNVTRFQMAIAQCIKFQSQLRPVVQWGWRERFPKRAAGASVGVNALRCLQQQHVAF